MNMTVVDELEKRFLLQEEYLGNCKSVNKIKPLVSVTVTAYQHVSYIRECLDSILMQNTDFPYEIIVGEDASTDGTREICIEYAEKHQDKIRLFLRDRTISHCNLDNRSVRFNGIFTRMSARGKYTAICEGDDYWIDPQKLQKQFNYLEANPSYGLLFTDADHLHEIDNYFIHAYDKTFNRKLPMGDVFEDLLYSNPYKTCTAFFNTSLIDDFNDIVVKRNFMMGDYPLWLIIAHKSKVAYLDDSTAVYRIRENSASHFRELENRIAFLKSTYRVSVFFSSYYHVNINKKKLKKIFHFSILNYLVEQRKFKNLFLYADCFPLALALIFKHCLRYLIVKKINM